MTERTHLQPRVLPAREGRDRAQVELEGELVFGADAALDEAFDHLRSISEVIGAVVTREGDGTVRAYPWNGPGSFRLHAPAGDEPVDRIDVLARSGEVIERHPMPELRERGERTATLKAALEKHMSPAEGAEPDPETFRINFADGTLDRVDADEEAR